MVLSDGERREYIKPIMFSGGIGQLDGSHINKDMPKKGYYFIAPHRDDFVNNTF